MLITLYFDFTSAECYALHELLAGKSLGDAVQWRGVQTQRSLPTPMSVIDRRASDRLRDELEEFARRVPALEFVIPKGMPNTGRAIVAAASVARRSPARAGPMLAAVFRGYWKDGVDISVAANLQRLADEAGVPRWVELDDPDAAEDVEAWEAEWVTERLGGVPRAIRSDGQLFWGLKSAAEAAQFFGAA